MKSTIKTVIITCACMAAISACKPTYLFHTKDWVARIDNQVITIDEYDQVFNMIINQYNSPQAQSMVGQINPNDPEVREQVIDDMINQQLIYNDLIKNKFDQNSNWQYMLEQVEQDQIAQYYVLQQFEGKITVTQDEAAEWWGQNEQRLLIIKPDLAYAEPDQLITIASQQLYAEKIQSKVEQIVNDCRGEFIVEYNTNALMPLAEGEKYKPGDWVARIDNVKFTRYAFDTILKLYMEEGNMQALAESDPDFINFDPQDPSDRKLFLDKLLESRIVYLKAKRDKFLDDPDHKYIIEYLKLTTVNQVYILYKFKNSVTVTPTDVYDFVNQNKDRYPEIAQIAQNGIDESEMAQIESYLQNVKLEESLNSYTETLRGEHRIFKNREMYQPLSIPH